MLQKMKLKINKIFFFLLFILFSFNLKAWEVRSDSTLYINPWAGISYSNIMGFAQNASSLIALSYGIELEYRFNPELAFKSGVLLLNKGNKYLNEYFDIENNPIGEFKTYNKFQYLSTPFLLTYNFGRKKFNVFLDAGLSFNFLLEEKTFANLPEFFNGVRVNPIDVRNTEAYKTFNFAFNLGFGFEYKIKPNILVFAQARYDHGVNKILKANTSYIFKHRGYYIGIGLKFGIPIKYSVAGTS